MASLAEALRLDPMALALALRPAPGRRALAGPFHYAWLTHGVLTTQVARPSTPPAGCSAPTARPFPGLRAGGGVAMGLAGEHSAGYSSGNGLLSAFGMGWIVGNEIAARADLKVQTHG